MEYFIIFKFWIVAKMLLSSKSKRVTIVLNLNLSVKFKIFSDIIEFWHFNSSHWIPHTSICKISNFQLNWTIRTTLVKIWGRSGRGYSLAVQFPMEIAGWNVKIKLKIGDLNEWNVLTRWEGLKCQNSIVALKIWNFVARGATFYAFLHKKFLIFFYIS